jgi:archaellum component FlaC
MNTQDMLQKAKTSMNELEEDYKKLKNRTKLAKTDLEIDYKMKMHELRLKLDELGDQLQQQGESGKESWQVLAQGFERAADELKTASKDAWSKFKD